MADDLFSYHSTLSACNWPHEVEMVDIKFRRTMEGEAPELWDRVLAEHRKRVKGESSPGECDKVARGS